MKRREMLRTTAVVATATGLAGCGGILGGGCSKPSGDMEDAAPSGGEYERQGDVRTSEGDEDTEGSVYAQYTGPDEESLYFGITEFTDSDTAESNVDETERSADGEFGYVRVGEFVYFATGPDEDSVKALLAEAKPLNEGCVDSNVEFA